MTTNTGPFQVNHVQHGTVDSINTLKPQTKNPPKHETSMSCEYSLTKGLLNNRVSLNTATKPSINLNTKHNSITKITHNNNKITNYFSHNPPLNPYIAPTNHPTINNHNPDILTPTDIQSNTTSIDVSSTSSGHFLLLRHPFALKPSELGDISTHDASPNEHPLTYASNKELKDSNESRSSLQILPNKRSTSAPPIPSSWQPPHKLPHARCDHPLDEDWTVDEPSKIQSICSMATSTTFVSLPDRPLDRVSVGELCALISHNSEINQQIINIYLKLLNCQFKIPFLDSSFYTLLKDNSWNRVTSWFQPNHRKRSYDSRPSLQDSVIAIPCHVNGCHWVAITRRVTNGRVSFSMQMTWTNLHLSKESKENFQIAMLIFTHYPLHG